MPGAWQLVPWVLSTIACGREAVAGVGVCFPAVSSQALLGIPGHSSRWPVRQHVPMDMSDKTYPGLDVKTGLHKAT